METGFAYQGEKYRVQVLKKDLESSPLWDPGSAILPPLGVIQACEVANTEVIKYVSTKADPFISEICLRRFRETTQWIYDIGFGFKDDHVAGVKDVFHVVVLMSGKCAITVKDTNGK